MKIFSWNAQNGQSDDTLRFLGSFTGYDIYIIQNFKYSALINGQTKGTTYSVQFGDQKKDIIINFTNQKTIKDCICLQWGFPSTFKFKLCCGNFTFFPSKQNFTPRKYQSNLQLIAVSKLEQCWLNEHQAIEGSHIRLLQDMLETNYIYFSGDKYGNLILSKKAFLSVEEVNDIAPHTQRIRLQGLSNIFFVNISFPENIKLKQQYAHNLCDDLDQHMIICGAFMGQNRADTQNQLENEDYEHIEILLERLADCQWGSPRGMIQDCCTPTNNKLQIRDDFIFTTRDLKKTVTDYKCIQCNISQHNFVTAEVHIGLCGNVEND